MNKKIIITKETKITDALNRLKNSGSRCLVVLDKNDTVIGTLSDGDLRKKIISAGNTKGIIKDVYNKKPYTIKLKDIKLKSKKIFDLFVKKKLPLIPIVDDKNKKYIKTLFFENFLKEKKIKLKKIDCPVVIMAGGKGTD